ARAVHESASDERFVGQIWPDSHRASRYAGGTGRAIRLVTPTAMKQLFLSFVLISSGGAFGRSETSPAAPSLSDFFKPGVALLDTNDDGAIDFVDARIVLPDRPRRPSSQRRPTWPLGSGSRPRRWICR